MRRKVGIDIVKHYPFVLEVVYTLFFLNKFASYDINDGWNIILEYLYEIMLNAITKYLTSQNIINQ